MPWFPDFASAVELARRQTRAAGQADPAGQYFEALNKGDTHVLETVWPGEVVVYDPHAGEIRGHRQMRRFVKRSQSWLAERHARTETVASTVVGDRAVLELLAYLADDGRELAWPVAVVAESPDDRSVVFRAYYSVGPVDGRRQVMLTSAARSGARQQYAAGRQPAEPARSLVMHWPVPGTWRHSPQRRRAVWPRPSGRATFSRSSGLQDLGVLPAPVAEPAFILALAGTNGLAAS